MWGAGGARAFVRENGVGAGQLGQGDHAAPEKGRGVGAQFAFHPGGMDELGDGVEPGVGADADGRAVLRFGQRLARGDLAFVAVVRVLRSPFAEDAGRAADHDGAIIERGIFHQRAGKKSFRESRGVNKRQHRGAGRAARLEGAVVFVMLEIAPADEGKDAAASVVERDDRALQIFRRGGALSFR